jgi:hypothetical protein
MGDSQLNGAERSLQQPFRKLSFFNALLVGAMTLAAYVPLRELPDRKPQPPRTMKLIYRPVALSPAAAPLRLAGAWEMEAADRRLRGLSGLTIDGNQLLAVSDRGAAIRFDPPSAPRPSATLMDLGEGPGPADKKWSRDAESIARDPEGRGWWVGYEQRHSLWLYEDNFGHAKTAIDLPRLGWRDNRGAEGLIGQNGALLVLAENGRDAVRVKQGRPEIFRLHADSEVADAARGPDGSTWVLLRQKSISGINQSIAFLRKTHDGYMIGPSWPVPKKPFDNYEGMAIERRPDGRWRFWLVTDDGHRFMARTLLVALDLVLPVRNRHDKSPAKNAGLSKKPSVKSP